MSKIYVVYSGKEIFGDTTIVGITTNAKNAEKILQNLEQSYCVGYIKTYEDVKEVDNKQRYSLYYYTDKTLYDYDTEEYNCINDRYEEAKMVCKTVGFRDFVMIKVCVLALSEEEALEKAKTRLDEFLEIQINNPGLTEYEWR